MRTSGSWQWLCRCTLRVLALELGYIADHGVEILAPQTYGEESSQPKGITVKQQWDEPKLFAKLAAASTPAGIEATRQLYAWIKRRANHIISDEHASLPTPHASTSSASGVFDPR